MVMQYSLSQYFDDVGGDTFMSTVPALNNFASDYTYQAPFIEDHRYTVTLTITIKKSEKNGLLLDQQPIQVLFCQPRVEVTSCFIYKVMGLTFHDRINTQLTYRFELAQVLARRITKPQRFF